MLQRFAFLLSLSTLFIGCASGTFKARQEQREKLAANTGMYCEFVSGDLFPDLDVELSMSMARRCDANKSFAITNYKNASDHSGVMYCCSVAAGKRASASSAKKATSAPVTTPSPEAEVVPE